MEDHRPQPTADDGHTPAESEASVALIEQQMWQAAVGGKNKGRVFDLGSEAHFSSRTYTSLPPPPPPPQNPAQEDRIGRLEEMMASMMVMIRELQANDSLLDRHSRPPPIPPQHSLRSTPSHRTMTRWGV
ncbi:UNVERIFIED_CONTAM: hypothetical protein Slati_2502000 [Sesamum latifolium]|uniref:Uncharacterized protein n=1 Tax=Sesamum latifolium TaxID=2727402 RepID=A0AAW2WIZ4_9LAMI